VKRLRLIGQSHASIDLRGLKAIRRLIQVYEEARSWNSRCEDHTIARWRFSFDRQARISLRLSDHRQHGGHLGWAPSALKRFAHRRSIPAQLRHLTIAIALINSGSLDLPLSAT
jgi:hypothetical protein